MVFYDTLLAFLDECVEQGMLTQEKREIVLVARTVDEALDAGDCLGKVCTSLRDSLSG